MEQNRVYRVTVPDTKFQTYYIASTAPINVEDPTRTDPHDAHSLRDLRDALNHGEPNGKKGIHPVALEELATEIAARPRASITFFIHGYNSDVPLFLRNLGTACDTLQPVTDSEDVFLIGYHWPSEHLSFNGIVSASPAILWTLLGLGIVIPMIGALLAGWVPFPLNEMLKIGAGVIGAIFTSIPVAALIFRFSVYYRDFFRANQYGVSDLVDLIRTLDRAVGETPRANRLTLSFVGHSLGAYVIVNAARVLNDVFSSQDHAPRNSTEGNLEYEKRNDLIGNNFCLSRLVLASPDIPAETVIAGRANPFLSALRRFDEVYLFSNMGDEVLRQVSRTANYFMFPNRLSSHGYRLGNMEVVPENSQVPVQEAHGWTARRFFDCLRLGKPTLARLSAEVGHPPSEHLGAGRTFPGRITFFDCTDYRDEIPHVGVRRLLSIPGRRVLGPLWHLILFLQYFLVQAIDVHGGYFRGKMVGQMLFGLAALGWEEYLQGGAGEKDAGTAAQFVAHRREWEKHGLRVLLRPQTPTGYE